MNKLKRLNPAYFPGDLDGSVQENGSKSSQAAEDSKTDDPELDSLLSKLGLTPDDLLLTPEERSDKFWSAYFANRDPSCTAGFKEVELPETLPEGCAWGSYVPGSGKKQFVYKKSCHNCGDGGHSSDECQDKDTPEAEEFRRQNLTVPSYDTRSKK